MTVDKEAFIECYVKGNRFDMLTSNISESLNASLLSERQLGVYGAMAEIVRKIGELFQKQREKCATFLSTLPPVESDFLAPTARSPEDVIDVPRNIKGEERKRLRAAHA
ncbi:uncharacterized protein TRIADDRAFT_62752, partial [Trichoplax adhaerens]